MNERMDDALWRAYRAGWIQAASEYGGPEYERTVAEAETYASKYADAHTQRAPTLTQCIEREREAVEALHVSNPGCLSPTCRCAPRTKLNAARAATDEAVRAVEARIAELEAENLALLNQMDAVVSVLGIAGSDIDPADEIRRWIAAAIHHPRRRER